MEFAEKLKKRRDVFDDLDNWNQDENTPDVEISIIDEGYEALLDYLNELNHQELKDIGYDPDEEKNINDKEKNLAMLDIITDTLNVDELSPSAFALKDVKISDTEKEALSAFLKSKKTDFARAYVEEIQKGGYKEPSWITEIKNFFK